MVGQVAAWYEAASPLERMSWGGLAACGLLGGFHLLERWWRLRQRRGDTGGICSRGFSGGWRRESWMPARRSTTAS